MNGTELLYEISDFLQEVCSPLIDKSEYMIVNTYGYADLFSIGVIDDFKKLQLESSNNVNSNNFVSAEVLDENQIDLSSKPKWLSLSKLSEMYGSVYVYESGVYKYIFTDGVVEYTAYGVMGYRFNEERSYIEILSLCYVPRKAYDVWSNLTNKLIKFSQNRDYFRKYVQVVGGNNKHIKDLPDIDSVILPHSFKNEIINDVFAFFDRVDVYLNLNIKPFRKFLFAGVPGTGKTLLCGAIAKLALSNDLHVIYISADDLDGPSFGKISEALYLAYDSQKPTIIIVEELDTYVRIPHHKAKILNILDGMDAEISDKGVLLISTTNYPEEIDERIFKRPGRIDRIYVFESINDIDTSRRTLKHYLGKQWNEGFNKYEEWFIEETPAFIREVVIQVMLRYADEKQNGTKNLDILFEESYKIMKAQSKIDKSSLKNKQDMGFGHESDIYRSKIAESPPNRDPNIVR